MFVDRSSAFELGASAAFGYLHGTLVESRSWRSVPSIANCNRLKFVQNFR